MADAAPVFDFNTPEHVAFKLLQEVAYVEGKTLTTTVRREGGATREWLLDTYAECLRAAKGSRPPPGR